MELNLPPKPHQKTASSAALLVSRTDLLKDRTDNPGDNTIAQTGRNKKPTKTKKSAFTDLGDSTEAESNLDCY